MAEPPQGGKGCVPLRLEDLDRHIIVLEAFPEPALPIFSVSQQLVRSEKVLLTPGPSPKGDEMFPELDRRVQFRSGLMKHRQTSKRFCELGGGATRLAEHTRPLPRPARLFAS